MVSLLNKYTHAPAGVVVVVVVMANNFKHLFHRYLLAKQSQISCGASLGRTKVYINGPGHMTKMAAMLITLKDLILQNHSANCLETWYVASGSVVLQSLYKS